MWIGLRRDDSNKNQWIWVDGQKVTYSNWGAGEPNNINEECVVMNTSPSGKWYDDRCSERRPYVCEKEGRSENLCLYRPNLQPMLKAIEHFWGSILSLKQGFFFQVLLFLRIKFNNVIFIYNWTVAVLRYTITILTVEKGNCEVGFGNERIVL